MRAILGFLAGWLIGEKKKEGMNESRAHPPVLVSASQLRQSGVYKSVLWVGMAIYLYGAACMHAPIFLFGIQLSPTNKRHVGSERPSCLGSGPADG